MTLLSRLSIRQKLAALLMMTSSIVLIVASLAYLTWDYFRFRADMSIDLEPQAELVLDNTAAALTFNDAETAREALEMLSINPHVRLACLYASTGGLFTEVRFDNLSNEGPCPSSVAPGARFTSDRLEVIAATDARAQYRRQGVARSAISMPRPCGWPRKAPPWPRF